MASEAAWGPRSSLARTPLQPMHGSPVTARQHPVQGSVLSLGSLQACPREGTSVREVSPVYWQFCIAVNGNSDAVFSLSLRWCPAHRCGAGFRAGSALPGSRPWWPPLLLSPSRHSRSYLPSLTCTHLHPLGGSREPLAGSWPRGLLEGACSRSCWVPACPPQTGPWEGGRAAVDLELDVGSGLQNRAPTQDRGQLHGADLRLELTGEQLLLCQFVAECVPPPHHPPCVNRLFPDPPSTPHMQ